MGLRNSCIVLSALLIGIHGLTGCIATYTNPDGEQCSVSPLTPVNSLFMGTGAIPCHTGPTIGSKEWEAQNAESRARVASAQASDWADSALSDLREAKSAKANGWSDQVADHIANARRNARGTRDFANTAKGLAELATKSDPDSASAVNAAKFAQEADAFATTAEMAAAEAAQFL
ncbi:hypothetical protein [Yersinia pseudotuberculosis]|uniref:hypothetical protein n=1 Tax=Yersinia pseudotuberculosis TaxID=633 RepID=UPI000F6E6A18|nr:hypothetical protein [Yersinia pseudotuberculosis]VEE72852.1 Uncharacterised protein [Yersinia pseudotuberculosis]